MLREEGFQSIQKQYKQPTDHTVSSNPTSEDISTTVSQCKQAETIKAAHTRAVKWGIDSLRKLLNLSAELFIENRIGPLSCFADLKSFDATGLARASSIRQVPPHYAYPSQLHSLVAVRDQ
ncbi:hypothetical protein FRC07_009026 [Ceratobasidium sp. 392]|nr:hypothetical protein FRC07_009026 [Ceratobasidium sp. 392]